MTEEKYEQRCDALSREAADWITDRLNYIKGAHGRGQLDLELAIYGWLIEHAGFD